MKTPAALHLTATERRVLTVFRKRYVSLALIEGRRIYAVGLHLGKRWSGDFLPGDVVRRLQDRGLIVGHAKESGETRYFVTSLGHRALNRK